MTNLGQVKSTFVNLLNQNAYFGHIRCPIAFLTGTYGATLLGKSLFRGLWESMCISFWEKSPFIALKINF